MVGLLQGGEWRVIINFCCFVPRGHCVYPLKKTRMFRFIFFCGAEKEPKPYFRGWSFMDGKGKLERGNLGFCLFPPRPIVGLARILEFFIVVVVFAVF